MAPEPESLAMKNYLLVVFNHITWALFTDLCIVAAFMWLSGYKVAWWQLLLICAFLRAHAAQAISMYNAKYG
jgi:hypothetical protein